MNLENIIETYGTIVTVIIILKIIYYLILISRIGDIKYEIKKELNKQDEWIAKALEQETEPYIIKKEDD